MAYNHTSIEQKWQKFWEENKTFKSLNPLEKGGSRDEMEAGGLVASGNQSSVTSGQLLSQGALKPKKYILDMFPYPSGAGLHVGHPKGYTATDVVSRYYHATGHNVLHTMGFDAFGLPAENYAIKTGTHPAVTTAENIGVFTEQLKSLGFSYDWDRVVDTTDPEYYKWTQWIFLELFKRGLAYEQDLPINYCPSCKTGLANEEVTALNTCDRCGTQVERRPIRQWVLKITEYADRLLSDIDNLDWPEGIKEMQRNWIGKSEGCEFRMIKDTKKTPENGDKKKRGLPLSASGGGLNCPAKPSLFDSIVKSAPKVKQKLGIIRELDATIENNSVYINIKSKDIFQHFTSKSVPEFHKRRKLFTALLESLENISFEEDIGYFIVECTVVKVVLGKQSNGNHFVKTYYVADRLTKEYREYIQKSEGEKSITMPSISVYTTRIDTVYGMTYAVLAPDHPKVEEFITEEQREICQKYIEGVKGKSDQDRTNDGKEKTGVFTGSYVVNPYNGESVPLWIADYVLGHYGTGAVMAVPAHDERDFAFAKKYDLLIKTSIAEKFGDTLKNFVPRTGVGAFILNDAGEILLQSQTYPRGEMFSLPGGGVEEGENYKEALDREIREETGYTDFEIQDCIGAFEYNYYSPERGIDRKLTEFTYAVILKSQKKEALNLTERELKLDLKNIWTSKGETIAKLVQTKDFCGFPEERVLCRYFEKKAFGDDGILVNSGEFNGISSIEARKVLIEKAETEGFGHKKVNYKLRDWLFSRQRYWGEPIPLIHISHEDFDALPRISDISEATDSSLAYIFDKKGTEKRCKNCTCEEGCTKLIIGGKSFSKVYDGITGKIIIDSLLPLTLPEVEKYEPAGDGQSPLATVPEWVNVKLAENLNGKRETNTMPQWGGSCWYYLRYMDPRNPDALGSKEALEYWGMVDEYVGGAEHAVLHLLYARFWHKVLYDIGVVPHSEPFQKLTNVGMILAYAYERGDGSLVAVDLVGEVSSPPVKGGSEAGGFLSEKKSIFIEKSTGKEVKQVVAKMSKSLKNVVNPNDIVKEYGADTLRLYEMSMSGFTDTAPWNPDAIIGVRRFLDKAYAAFTEKKNLAKDDMKAMKLLHKTVKKVGEDIVEYKFNTAISALMILLNEGIPVDEEFAQEWKEKFAILLHPFAPHMAEELFDLLEKGGAEERGGGLVASEASEHQSSVISGQLLSQGTIQSIYHAPWPEYDEFMLVDDEVTIAVQIAGKLRGTFTFPNGVAQEEVSIRVQEDENIAKWLEGKEIIKEIFIPNKMLSIVVR